MKVIRFVRAWVELAAISRSIPEWMKNGIVTHAAEPAQAENKLECVKTAHTNLITLVDKTFQHLSNLITFFNVHIIYERKSGKLDWLHVLCIRCHTMIDLNC